MTILDTASRAASAQLKVNIPSPYVNRAGTIITVVQPNRLIMSHETEVMLMRADYSNYSGICGVAIKGEPRRIFGVHIVYDDTLADGVIVPALAEIAA